MKQKLVLILFYFLAFALLVILIAHKFGDFYYGTAMAPLEISKTISLFPSRAGEFMILRGNKLFININKLEKLKTDKDIKKEYNISKAPILYKFIKYRKNIVILGDSNAEGGGVKKNETFPYFLSKLVNANVVNLGYHGLNTKLEVERFKKLGLTYKPKIVILQYCENDYQDTLKYFTFIKEGFNFLRQNGYNLSDNPAGSINEAEVYRALHTFYFDYVFLPHREEIENRNIKEPCNELNKLSKKYNFSVALLIFGLQPFQRKFITDIAKEYNWQIIDLNRELGWKWKPPFTISNSNPHFSVSYNKKVAKLLYEKIESIDNVTTK